MIQQNQFTEWFCNIFQNILLARIIWRKNICIDCIIKIKFLLIKIVSVYQLIILPMIEKSPESLRWRNHDDITCRDLLDQLREKHDDTQVHVSFNIGVYLFYCTYKCKSWYFHSLSFSLVHSPQSFAQTEVPA